MSSGIPADGQNDGKAASQRGRWDESRAAAGFHTPHHTQWVRPHKECAAEKVREHSGVLSEVPGVPSAIHLWGAVPQDQSPQRMQYKLRQV